MDALTQRFARLHLAEKSEHPHVARPHLGDRAEEQDHEQECGDSQADKSKQAAAVAATAVKNSAVRWIENRHRSFSPVSFSEILRRASLGNKWLLGLRIGVG